MVFKKILFAEYKVKLFKIFLPIMLSQLISQIQMVIDRIFLGRLEVLYMSAIGNATAPVWTTMSFVFSLSMGASILISQSIGARNEKQAREYAASLLVFHNVLPVVLFFFWVFCAPMVYRLMGVSENVMGPCVTYTRFYAPVFLLIGTGAALNVILQSSGNTKPLVVYGIIRSGMNVILDYVMIFGKFGFPAMGIAGAAIATTVSEFIGAIYIFVRVVKSRHLITKPTLDEVRHAKLNLYLKSVKLGIPTASEDFCWNFGNLMLIRILNTINEFAAAIYSIVFTIEVLAVVVIGSIGNGTVTLTSEATGSKDFKLFRSVVKTAYIWSAIVSGFTLVLCLLFPHQVLGWFTKDANIIQTSSIYLALVGINLFSKSLNIIIGNGIRGYGDTRWMFFTQIFGTVFVVSMALLFVIGLHLGIVGVFLAVLADEFVRGIINSIRFSKIRFTD